MIIEDEREEDEDFNYYQELGGLPELAPEDYQTRDPVLAQEFLKNHKAIEDKSAHEQLRNDLVEHFGQFIAPNSRELRIALLKIFKIFRYRN